MHCKRGNVREINIISLSVNVFTTSKTCTRRESREIIEKHRKPKTANKPNIKETKTQDVGGNIHEQMCAELNLTNIHALGEISQLFSFSIKPETKGPFTLLRFQTESN